MARRNDIKSTAMFNREGPGSGVWAGAGITKTKPSRTLFVTAIPFGVDFDEVEKLFKAEKGFSSFRTVRRMCFADFENERVSTLAMRKLQGYKFPGQAQGIAIDYDKDHVSKRNKSYELERQKRMREEDNKVLRYYCCRCRTRCLLLEELKPLDKMPRRSTDKAFCVNEAKYLRALNVVRGELLKVKREKGVEKQYTLACTLCDAVVAYRPVPIGTETKFLYVVSGATTSDGRCRDYSKIVGTPKFAATPSMYGSLAPTDLDLDKPAEEDMAVPPGVESSSGASGASAGAGAGGGASGSGPVPASGGDTGPSEHAGDEGKRPEQPTGVGNDEAKGGDAPVDGGADSARGAKRLRVAGPEPPPPMPYAVPGHRPLNLQRAPVQVTAEQLVAEARQLARKAGGR